MISYLIYSKNFGLVFSFFYQLNLDVVPLRTYFNNFVRVKKCFQF